MPDTNERAAFGLAWIGAIIADWIRVTVLLGAVAAIFLVAHSRLTDQHLPWLLVAQYGLAIGAASLAFALVPRAIRRRSLGYAGACAAGGFVAVLVLAWMVEVDLSALAAPPAAAVERLGDLPLRTIASPEVRRAGPTVLREIARGAMAVDPLYLGFWAGVGAVGGTLYGWATRALR